ncbi:MAG TPA: DUF1573 domain-containing protein [Bacteroidales bacterium]|nr:DUF1573 domain-containing protein [Bacteroidales bacterium]
MKKLTFLIALLMLVATGSALAGPTISFPTKTHDFGTINEEDGTATYEFAFTNKGDAPLIILKAIASCGCTTPVYTKEPIAPGGSSTIRVTYNTLGRPNAFHKTITVYTNDPSAPNVVLIIQGIVTPKGESPEVTYPKNMQGLRLKRTIVPMLETRIGSIKTETIDVVNTNKTPMSIGFNKVPKHIQVSASNTLIKPNQTAVITVKYSAEAAKDYGKREDSFYIVTNPKDRSNPNNRIHLSANLTEDFSRLNANQLANAPVAAFSENRINFGKMARGTSKTLSVKLVNNGKSNLHIRKIVPEYDGLKITPSSMVVAPGKIVRLAITFHSGTFDGNVVQRFTVITNDPKASINRLFVTALVTAN